MTNKYKLIKYFHHKDLLTGASVKFARIKVPNKITKIESSTGLLEFPMDTIYDVPASEIDDPKKYMEPLFDSDYNVKRSFNIYRKKMGLLSPKRIKYARKSLGLSQPDIAAVLGMSVSVMSKIENNRFIQTLSQDTRLRCLTDWDMLENLIKAHLPMIQLKHSSSVKLSRIKRATKKIEILKAKRGIK